MGPAKLPRGVLLLTSAAFQLLLSPPPPTGPISLPMLSAAEDVVPLLSAGVAPLAEMEAKVVAALPAAASSDSPPCAASQSEDTSPAPYPVLPSQYFHADVSLGQSNDSAA